MPHVEINMMSGRSEELKKKVAEDIVQAMMDSLGCERSHLSVSIIDVDPAEWNEKMSKKVDKETIYAGELYEAK
ncbi:MAG: tautomerase family protein [Mogibacterium sp.]|nr:tautomerase family protein [Mogibacterium sp.]